MPDANPPVTGADTNVYRESDHVESLQTPCRSAYGGRALSNALFIKSFYILEQLCA